MSRSFGAIPVIDISSLYSPDLAARQAAARQIGQAAADVGFLYIRGHDVAPTLIEAVLRAAQGLFALPRDRKMDWYIGRSANHSGYVPEGEEVFEGGKVDRKEAYDIGLDAPGGGAPMLGPNLWPDLDGFQAPVAAYYAAMAHLARILFRGFALALGLPEDHFEPHRTAPPSQLRLIHYPFDPDPGDGQGIGAHTDYEFFTILHGTAPGLEVMNGEGAWIDAPPIPGCLVINIGDMLEAWTNGAFTATSHRVRKVGVERYSFPFFATCDYATVVAPHPRFVSDDRPARYPPMVSGEHLFAQTVKTFAYLKARRGAEGGPAFGQAARLSAGA